MSGWPSTSRRAGALRRAGRVARHALGIALVLVWPGTAQNGPMQPHYPIQQPIGQSVGGPIGDLPSGDPLEEERRLRELNKERQKSMTSDANKLLKLAGELSAEIERQQSDTLTSAQLHKLAEIEKLAHNVKDKMSYSVRSGPVFQQPPPPYIR